MSQGEKKDVVTEGRDQPSLEKRDVILKGLDRLILQARISRGNGQLPTTTMTATEKTVLGGIMDEIGIEKKSQEA